MADVQLNWNSITTGQSYKVEHKKSSDSTWTTDTTGLTTTTYVVTGLDNSTSYDFRVTATCAGGSTSTGVVTNITTPTPTVYIWVEDTYTCAQDNIFTEVARVDTLSSPSKAFYYAPQGRMYVIDADDPNGIFWWFDPNTFSNASQRNYIPGTTSLVQCYMQAYDTQYNRLYATGFFTGGSTAGGLLVYDIPSNTVTTVPYGSNVTSAFSRTTIAVEGNYIYCGDRTNKTLSLINRSTLTLDSVVDLTTVPGIGTKRVTAGCSLTFINGEVWVWNTGDNPSDNDTLLIYNPTFTTVLGEVDVTAYRSEWFISQPNSVGYWGKSYYDAEKKIFYGTDYASKTLIAVDTTTKTIKNVITLSNLEGFNSFISNIVNDPITNDVYFTGTESTISGVTTGARSRSYRINRDNIYIEQLYPDLTINQFERQGSTNFVWGMVPGRRPWDSPNTGWNTDGVTIKFSR